MFQKGKKTKNFSPNTYTTEDKDVILLLIKNNLNPTPFTPGDTDVEILWVTISPHPNIKWQIGVCYRPENDQALILEQNQGFNKLNRNSDCLILGKFHFRKIVCLKGEGTSK